MVPSTAALATPRVGPEESVAGARPRPASRLTRAHHGVQHLLGPLLLVALTMWMGAGASVFSGTPKGYDAFGHIAKVRFLIENWPHVSWNYSWYSGMPTFQGSYPPGYHGLVAVLAGPLGLGISTAMNGVALASMLAIVLGCYATVHTATSSRRWALFAGVLLVATPALWSHAVETGLFPRLLGMGATALALAAATRFTVRGGRLPFVLAALATAAALSSHVVVGVIAVGLVAGVLLIGPRGSIWTRIKHAAGAVGLAAALAAYFYLPFAVLGGNQTPFVDAVNELGWRNLVWPADKSMSGLSPVLLLAALAAVVVAVRGLRAPAVGLRDKLALGIDLPWLTHPVGPVPAGGTAAVRRWDAWRLRVVVEGFSLRLAVFLLAAFPCVLAYGTIGYVDDAFPFFVGGLQPSDLLGYLAFFGATAVGLVGGSVAWRWPARISRNRTPLRAGGLVLVGAAVAAALLGTASALTVATRLNPATGSWLVPAWSDQRQLRVAGAIDSTTNIVNTVSRVPQTRGYQANGTTELDWQIWLEQSQHAPDTSRDVRRFLLDWHAVGWVLVDVRSESAAPYTSAPSQFRAVSEGGYVRTFAYLDASPILGAADAPTVLVVGDKEHYDLVLRALSFGGIDSSRLLTLQGPASADDLSPADLAGADTVLLYGATVNDPAAVNEMLRDYVTRGGRLVVEDSDDDSSVAALTDQDGSVLPVRRPRTRTVTTTWNWRAPVEPLTAGIDLSEFAPPSYAGSGRWDVRAVPDVRRWARPLLSTGSSVVAAAGEIGRGESIWSGIGLPYHAASFGSSVESDLIGQLLDAPRDPQSTPASAARFVHSQRREITVGPDAGGVLFKERYAEGWHARTGDQDLRIASAGPGMMYVALPSGHGSVTVVLTYRTSPVEKVGYAVSLLALLGVLTALARRPRRWRRADSNA
ncbi:MAG: DUF6541 family protein [Sporichthyaceae bacterium]